jgi:hypothetical protein
LASKPSFTGGTDGQQISSRKRKDTGRIALQIERDGEKDSNVTNFFMALSKIKQIQTPDFLQIHAGAGILTSPSAPRRFTWRSYRWGATENISGWREALFTVD